MCVRQRAAASRGWMSASDLFLLVVRWLHAVSAAAWVGGSLFYLLVVRPAQQMSPEARGAFTASLASEFRTLVNACIVVLVATGVILALDRLDAQVDATYVTTLGVKSALSAWMFVHVRDLRRASQVLQRYRKRPEPATTRLQRIARAVSGYNAIVTIGIIVYLLSDLLKVLFEVALTGR